MLDEGVADPSLASSVNATFSPASLSYGLVTRPNSVSKDLQITNQGSGANTYTITVQDLNPGNGVTLSPSVGQVSPAPGQSTTVQMTLTAMSTAVVGDHTGYVVITDSDNQILRVPYWVRIQSVATIQLNSATFSASEGPPPAGTTARIAQIVVTRQGDTAGQASVDFVTSNGTASQRTDYITAAGTIIFTAGQTTRTFNILIVDDCYTEPTETITITLSNPVGATFGTPTQATLFLDDDDDEGPATTSPLDDASYFVRQHYFDFLNRTPDTSGFNFWVSQITQCGTDVNCLRTQRITVSNAFFYEQEYQQTGSYVVRLYRAAFGNDQPIPNTDTNPQFPNENKKLVNYSAFSPDRARVRGGPSLAQTQLDLANAFVLRPQFVTKYPSNLDAPTFVDAVLATINNDLGVNLTSQRSALHCTFRVDEAPDVPVGR